MSITREDLLPQYTVDLIEKRNRVLKLINNLTNYEIEEISDISTDEYNLIKLAVINSIKGKIIASEAKSRQKFVEDVFLDKAKKYQFLDYEDISGREKCDFQGTFKDGIKFGLEVKGGEGNSLTILNRPSDCDIFIVWSHLDVMSNTPYENMRSVLGRIVKQMINRDERKQHVNFLVFYDKWYLTGLKTFKIGHVLPDVFVFPESIPTLENLKPEILDFNDNIFIKSFYSIFDNNYDLNSSEVLSHIWKVSISILQIGGKWKRRLEVKNAFYPDVNFHKSGSSLIDFKF